MAIKIPKLTKQQQQYLAVGAVVLGVGGFAYIKYAWMPLSARINKASEEIETTNKSIEVAKAAAARRPRLEAELALLNQQALEAEKRLPKTKSVPDILVTLTTLAQKYNVQVLSFTPGAETSKEYFRELQYPMTLRGTFHNIGRFFAAVALEQRIYNVQNVNFGSASEGFLSIGFVLVSYQYKG